MKGKYEQSTTLFPNNNSGNNFSGSATNSGYAGTVGTKTQRNSKRRRGTLCHPKQFLRFERPIL